MDFNTAQFVKNAKSDMAPEKILLLPVTHLAGVSDEVAEVLKSIGIKNIFDLGASKIFNAAWDIAMGSTNPESLYAKMGVVPSDVVNKDAEGKPSEELIDSGIGILEGIGKSSQEKLAETLHLETIRDLSLWPPFHVAKRILINTFGTETNKEDEDSEAPEELLPVAGKHATETLSYEKVFIHKIGNEGNAEGLIELTEPGEDNEGQQVDILASASEIKGFSSPATGAVLTFTQTWTPEALSLGQLLHSVGLAPGESTKIAVIEWSRTETGSLEEAITQSESLTADSQQSRAIAEIQNAVATEVQQGFSAAHTSATSKTSGMSAGLILGPLGLGGSRGKSSTTGSSISVSSSSGRRDISAEMTQNITASTRQSSTSVRNKRAAVVREVKQEEKEEIRTRIITNYNHSHALSIHYYEVVQIYKTAVQLSKFDRCIFIPMKPLDFNDVRLIDRYRTVLYDGALTSFTRDLIEAASGDVQANLRMRRRYGPSTLNFPPDSSIRMIKNILYNSRENTDGAIIHLKNNRTEVVSQDSFGRMILDTPIPVIEVEKIELKIKNVENDDNESSLTRGEILINAVLGDKMVNNRTAFYYPEESGTELFLEFKQPELDKQLSELLNEERLYYSQLIWQNLTADEVALQLSHHTYHGRRLLEEIDAVPLTTYGNYLVFRWHPPTRNINDIINVEASLEAENPIIRDGFEIPDIERRVLNADWEWEQWKKKHINMSRVEEAFVPLPTEGVFTEAVLGRYNASEKLDITRFWDWQESPIPHQAPDIAPIQSGSRATDDGLTSPGLESPIVNIQNPQPLPDPAGLSSVLNAITTSNLFRDMSGMQQTAALLQQGIDTTGQAAVAGASLAAQNMKTMAELEAEKVGAVRDVLLAYMGAKPQGSSGSNSRVGAMINQGEKMDQQKKRTSESSPGIGSRGSGTTNGNSTKDNHASSNNGRSYQEEAFEAAVNPVRAAISGAASATDGNGEPVIDSQETEVNNRLSLEERQNSLNAPFVIEKVGTTGNHAGGIPMYAWIIYDFGVGNSDVLLNNNEKGPFAIRNELKQRYQELVDQDIWIDIEIYGYTDNSGSASTNQLLRKKRAISASEVFIPTFEGRKSNWRKVENNNIVIENEINLKLVTGAPIDYYLANNDTPEGRAKNRSVIIKEVAMHHVVAPGGVTVMPDEEEDKLAEIAEAIDNLRNSTNKYDLFKVRAYDLWQNPNADLRIFTEHNVKMAILENADPDAAVSPWNPFDDNNAAIGSNPLKYVTDYRSEIVRDLKNKNKSVDNVLVTLENLFRELFNGIDEMNEHLDAVSGISNNPHYIGVKIKDWIISQQQITDTAYRAALEFTEQ